MPKETELFFHALQSAIDNKPELEGADEETFNAFVDEFCKTYKRGGAPDVPQSPQEKAYELYCQASDILDREGLAAGSKEAAKLLRQAIKLDPHCYDAKLTLIEATSKSHLALMGSLVKLEAEARKYTEDELGLSAEMEDVWRDFRFRPYLRVCERLYDLYRDCGLYTKAIGMGERLLKLNWTDNQGIRFTLIGVYVMLEQFDKAAALFETYKREGNVWSLLSMGVSYFKQGDIPKARAMVRKLEAYCPAALPILLTPPSYTPLPPYYTPGSMEEAFAAQEDLRALIDSTPLFTLWVLEEQNALNLGDGKSKGSTKKSFGSSSAAKSPSAKSGSASKTSTAKTSTAKTAGSRGKKRS